MLRKGHYSATDEKVIWRFVVSFVECRFWKVRRQIHVCVCIAWKNVGQYLPRHWRAGQIPLLQQDVLLTRQIAQIVSLFCAKTGSVCSALGFADRRRSFVVMVAP